MACPIWPNHPAHARASRSALAGPSGGIRAATLVECPVCGTYEITYMTQVALEHATSMDDELRWRITWATRHASAAGAIKVLDSAELERLAESEAGPRSPLEKANSLLLLLAARSGGLGDRAAFNAETEWPLLYARGPNEATRLLAALVKKGLVTTTMSPAEGVELTYQGWQVVDTLPTSRTVQSTKAFVAMWFDPTMNAAYDDGFRPALFDLGYDPVRVDRQEFLGKIDDYIVKSIRESALVVADFNRSSTRGLLGGGVRLRARSDSNLHVPVR